MPSSNKGAPRIATAAKAGALALIALALAAQLGSARAVNASAGSTPISKIITIMFENHSRSQTRGTGAMPYLDSLADKYGEATNFRAAVHPSLGNYFTAQSDASASTCGKWDPLPSSCPQSGTTIFDEAIAAGKSAKYYAAGMPSNCYASDTNGYVAHHVPWTYFTSATSRANCERYAVPSGSSTSGNFASDLSAGTLPNVSWLIPTNFDNAHSAPLGDADTWLREWMTKILAGPDFVAGRLAIALTWDEPAPDQPLSTPIEFVLVSPHATGADTADPFTLGSLLRYQADVLGVKYLGAASAASDLAAWAPINAAGQSSTAPSSTAPSST
ncbi:MAG: putative hydrolase, partial [Jatrophihabitantaceae bacterium]|nr:putative hydrolase [Jatrophihabitantaceae bacterium]